MAAILIGCEESQAVCLAFRAQGHEAYSCDLKPCSGGHPEWHLQMDVFDAIALRKWGFIGLHPDCSKMTNTGNRTYGVNKPRHLERKQAVEWTISLWDAATKASDMVYMENPVGALNTDLRLPTPQIIQPYYFGDSYQKTTCLWLHGLKMLVHSNEDTLFESKTHVHPGEFYVSPRTGKRQPKWYSVLSTSGGNEKNRRLRSKTFPGIARAMAEQWGKFL